MRLPPAPAAGNRARTRGSTLEAHWPLQEALTEVLPEGTKAGPLQGLSIGAVPRGAELPREHRGKPIGDSARRTPHRGT